MQHVELEPASRYERETYGILYVGKFVHKISGANHNPNADFRIKVWDNTAHPNKYPEGRYTEMGYRGGPGQYEGPDGLGTDQPLSVTCSAQAVVIAAVPIDRPQHGNELSVGQVVRLKAHGGIVSLGDWLIDQKPLHDPHMTHVTD